MRTTILLLVLLTACVGDVGPCDPAPRWQLPFPIMSSLAIASDGTLEVWTDTELQRVDAGGQVIATVAIGASNGGPHVAVNHAGASAVALCSFLDGTGTIIVYDSALAMQRMLALPVCVQSIALGPAAQLAYTSGATLATTQVHALDPSGTERWAVTLGGGLQYASNGDVLVYDLQSTVLRRVELDAATGAIVADAMLPIELGIIPQFAPDGSYVVRTYDRLDAVGVVRRDATGADEWMRSLRSLIGAPVLGPTGDVVVTTDIATRVARLDAATGTTIATTAHCTTGGTIIGATADGYIVHAGEVLSSFAGP
jgi:outer membrane protein assembly factor BamB